MNTNTVRKTYEEIQAEMNYLTLEIVGKPPTILVPSIVAEYLQCEFNNGYLSPMEVLRFSVSQYTYRYVKNFFRHNNLLKFYQLVEIPNPFHCMKEEEREIAQRILDRINLMLSMFRLDLKPKVFKEEYAPRSFISSEGKVVYDEEDEEYLENLLYYVKRFLKGKITKEAPLGVLLSPFFLHGLFETIDASY